MFLVVLIWVYILVGQIFLMAQDELVQHMLQMDV